MGIFFSKSNDSFITSNKTNIINSSIIYNQKFEQLLKNINNNTNISKIDRDTIKNELRKIKQSINNNNTNYYNKKFKTINSEKKRLLENKKRGIIVTNKKKSNKNKKIIKEELITGKYNINKNISFDSKHILNEISENYTNVNIYWVRHGYSCANLEGNRDFKFKQSNTNLSDLGIYGLLAQQKNILSKKNNSKNITYRPQVNIESIIGSTNKIQSAGSNEFNSFIENLNTNNIDLFGTSELLRAIQTQSILFAPFNNILTNNEQNINVIHVLPYISEKRNKFALGLNKDNEAEDIKTTNKKFNKSLQYFKENYYINNNKNYELDYTFNPEKLNGKKFTNSNINKFFDVTLPSIINNLKNNNTKKEFNLIIVSHQNFIKDLVKKFGLIKNQQQEYDNIKNVKLPNQSIYLQKIKLYQNNKISHDKMVMISPLTFKTPMSYYIPTSINETMSQMSQLNKTNNDTIKNYNKLCIKGNENCKNNLCDIKYILNNHNLNIDLNNIQKYYIFENNPNVIDMKKQINFIIDRKITELFKGCDLLLYNNNNNKINNKFKKKILGKKKYNK
jgi:broad specificity phosphatase PhoE